jgi:putative ABC transport system permease protein
LLLAAALVFAVLSTSCVATLLLVRFADRRRELAIRAALGATRARIARQLIIEAVLVGGAGAATGISAAFPLAAVIRGLPFARFDEIRVDLAVAAFAMSIALLAAVSAALLPVAVFAREDIRARLAGGGRLVSDAATPFSRLTTAVQVAVAVGLVGGAAILSVSFVRLTHVDPGFSPAEVMTARVVFPRTRYASAADLRRIERLVVERVDALPEVSAAGMVSSLPFGGRRVPFNFVIEGRTAATHATLSTSELRSVSAGYFAAMRIPLLAGRFFDQGDSAHRPGVLLVNQTMAKRFWTTASPIGSRISFDGSAGPWLTIVGVVGDVRHENLRTPPLSEMYRPFAQEPWPSAALVVRVVRGVAPPTTAVRRIVREIDPELPVYDMGSMEELISRSTADVRLWMLVLQALGAAGLILATAGVFGVTAHTVRLKVPEIAIRMALGAGPRQVVTTIAATAMGPVVGGLAAGLALAWALGSGMSSLVHGVSARDPFVFAAAAAFVLLAAVTATGVPARRALKVDPATALRRL